jgi:hypothetical protein
MLVSMILATLILVGNTAACAKAATARQNASVTIPTIAPKMLFAIIVPALKTPAKAALAD